MGLAEIRKKKAEKESYSEEEIMYSVQGGIKSAMANHGWSVLSQRSKKNKTGDGRGTVLGEDSGYERYDVCLSECKNKKKIIINSQANISQTGV